MKRFIVKLLVISVVFFAILETYSRFRIDPKYYYAINTLNEKLPGKLNDTYKNGNSEHVDFLFIGSSRIPATINPMHIKQLSGGKVAVNEGRGYMTPGIHYQALKNRLEESPEYLKNAVVVIEYAGSQIYTNSFEQDKFFVYEPLVDMDKPMPHLLLPHLNWSSFRAFLHESKNSAAVKKELSILYLSSTYRAFQFLNDRFNVKNTNHIFKGNTEALAAEGGIRNDNIEVANQKAIDLASQEKNEILNAPPLTREIIDNSTFAMLRDLISTHDGKLMVYKMPLHSIQKDIYSTSRAQNNKTVFEEWLDAHNIPIVYTPDFVYSDNDFPDTWHLSIQRRDEFTEHVYKAILQLEVKSMDKEETANK